MVNNKRSTTIAGGRKSIRIINTDRLKDDITNTK